ncbi:MAG: type IV toxin-antitoxin system AbiEi family antitoxin domain-containing protein [Verrucomicrobiota bacterium]|nr:type IV toxin-antitoxin system AbiEi family antitoxin domain-containing protein [Verrucomicrobiota bacterium]
MRPKACLKALAPLRKRSPFSSRDARKRGVSSAALSHYVKTGKLRRVRRGMYQDAAYKNRSPSLWSDLVEAVHSVPGGIVCLISALSIYDLTEELPRQHWIAIRHETSSKSTRLVKITRFRDTELGRTEIELDGFTLPIFDRERTIIDAFRLLSRETAIKALKMALQKSGKNRLDLRKLEAYAKQLRFDITPYLLTAMT